MWTQDHILFSLFRRCSGEMENFALSSFGFGWSGVSFTADIPLFNSNITNFAFCAFKGVEELAERIASMERGGADATLLISRRFAFSFVLHATRHSKCGGDCR